MTMETEQVIEVAKGITDYGALAIIGAVYIVLSATIMITIFGWFKSIINQILKTNESNLKNILKETQKQNELLFEVSEGLNDVSEGLRIETQLRIKNLSGFAFDLAAEKTFNFINQVIEENNISDLEKTHKKIRDWLSNQYEDRKAKFDPFTYRGRPISTFCNPEWINILTDVVKEEVYSDKPNSKRARTNINIIYDNIKTDFYHRLNNE